MVKIALDDDRCVFPVRGSEGASGFDLTSIENKVIYPGAREAIDTGLKFEIPLGFEGQVRPRSGNALIRGITVLNTPGTIDCDFIGRVKVILYNTTEDPVRIEQGDKIAQLVIAPVWMGELLHVDVKELTVTERGEKGFGSTGHIG